MVQLTRDSPTTASEWTSKALEELGMSLQYSAEVAIGLSVLPAIQIYKLVCGVAQLGFRYLYDASMLLTMGFGTLITTADTSDPDDTVQTWSDIGSPSQSSSIRSFDSTHTPSPKGSLAGQMSVCMTTPGLTSDDSSVSTDSNRAGGSAAGSILRYREGPLSSTPIQWRRVSPVTEALFRDARDSPIVSFGSSPSFQGTVTPDTSQDSLYITFGNSPARKLFQPSSSPDVWFSDRSSGSSSGSTYWTGPQQPADRPLPPWRRYQVASLYRVHSGASEAVARGKPSASQAAEAAEVARLHVHTTPRFFTSGLTPASPAVPADQRAPLVQTSVHNVPHHTAHHSADPGLPRSQATLLNPRSPPYQPVAESSDKQLQMGADVTAKPGQELPVTEQAVPIVYLPESLKRCRPLSPKVAAESAVGAVVLGGVGCIDFNAPTHESLSNPVSSTRISIVRSEQPIKPHRSFASVVAGLPPRPSSLVIATAEAISKQPWSSVLPVAPPPVPIPDIVRKQFPQEERWDEEVSLVTSGKEWLRQIPVLIPSHIVSVQPVSKTLPAVKSSPKHKTNRKAKYEVASKATDVKDSHCRSSARSSGSLTSGRLRRRKESPGKMTSAVQSKTIAKAPIRV